MQGTEQPPYLSPFRILSYLSPVFHPLSDPMLYIQELKTFEILNLVCIVGVRLIVYFTYIFLTILTICECFCFFHKFYNGLTVNIMYYIRKEYGISVSPLYSMYSSRYTNIVIVPICLHVIFFISSFHRIS